jgi:phosphopantothenate-cysteine ligase
MDASIRVKASEKAVMTSVLESYKIVQSLQLLHSIPFVTVFDYLFLLRGIAQIMNGSPQSGQGVGRNGLYYLAAAVSDFFLPQQKMVCHQYL